MDTNLENIDSSNDEILNDEVYEESIDTSSNDTLEKVLETNNKIAESNKRLYARAKLAEQELKALKGEKSFKGETTIKNINNLNNNTQNLPTREELILIAKGHSEEDVNLLTKISKLENISLSEAENSDTYKIYKDKEEAKRKEEKASLGASKGSGRTGQKSVAEMTPEEHKAYFKEMMGR